MIFLIWKSEFINLYFGFLFFQEIKIRDFASTDNIMEYKLMIFCSRCWIFKNNCAFLVRCKKRIATLYIQLENGLRT